MIQFARIEIARGGGLCRRCPRPKHEFLPTEQLLGVVRSNAAAVGNVFFAGHRAAGHPDIQALAKEAARAGAQRIRVQAAHGINPEKIPTLLSAGVRQVSFTIAAANPRVLAAMGIAEKKLEAFKSAPEALREAARADSQRVFVHVRIPVCRHNVHELPGAVALAAEVRADAVTLEPVDGGLDLAGSAPWIAAACDTGMVNALWVDVEGVPYCLMPGHELHQANLVRSYAGEKARACVGCALDAVCDGVATAAAASSLPAVSPPEGAERIAERIRRVRGLEDVR
ncbi:MAG: hypothetical protein Kow0056_05170 [Coriobacteriia bacterium]